MAKEQKFNVDVFRVVCKAISHSNDLTTMAEQFTQLLVGVLEIKGCTIFVLNPKTKELEILASFGLSAAYLNKGPVMLDKGICAVAAEKPIVISDVSKDDRLAYPEEAKKEGICSIVSVCIPFRDHIIGGLRLYHRKIWDFSEDDMSYLLLLAEYLGLLIMFTGLLRTVESVNQVMGNLPNELDFPITK
jgi:signal transduction protein with GAF and PtsI domain